MALKDLAEYTTKQGNVTAVWYDDKLAMTFPK